MNDQERRLLQDFLEQLVQVRGITKDPEAAAMIEGAVARQPDAAYLLVQRSLLQEQALEAAKAQIASLQTRLQAGGQERAGTFLDAANSWGNSALAPAAVPAYASPPAPAYVAPRPSFMQGMSGGGGSFLGNMAATAAGVVGGAFLFQGIENLLSHHGGGEPAQHGFAGLDDQGGSQQLADLGSGNGDLASDAGIDDIGFDSGDDSDSY